jgi:MYXO-CTERM domain-containing protein
MRLVKILSIPSCTLALALLPAQAHAITIFASDCNFGFQDIYNAGDAVCVTGEMDVVPPGGICAEGYVIVTPTGGANPFFDVSMGGANYILGCGGAGAFYDEYVWLPPLIPGQYDLVIDQFPFFGAFGAEDYRLENAFSVSNAPIVFSVDVNAIKGAAMQGLAQAQALKDLVIALTIIDTLSTAADWAGAFGVGGAVAGIALGVICYATGADCPTSYNSAVITIGNKIIGHMGDALTLHYGAIIADPPDPMFEDVVALRYEDALGNGAPWAPLSGAPLPAGQTMVAQLLSTQAAAYQALLPTVEKLQGAQAASSHFGLLIQAEKTIAYSELAIEAGDAMLAELDGLQAALEAEGTYGTEVDAAGMLATLEAEGLSTEDRALIQSFGFSDAQIDDAIGQAGTISVPGPVSWAAVVDAARGSFETMRPALVDLSAQAEAIRAENEPYALRVAPVAQASAPAAAVVGETISLSASATHLDPDVALAYAWDLDGDGEFDDAMGANVDHVAPAPGLVAVAVEVSDGARRDIAMATVMVAVGNVPPEFTSFAPADYAPFADPGETVDLQATAEDADGDPVALTWFVDDVEASEGEAFAFEMPDEEFHAVRVVAADDDPWSADAVLTFHVRAGRWEGEVGETGGGTGDTGLDDTAGGADGTTSGGGNDAGESDGTAGTGSAGADGGDGGSGGCGCSSSGSSMPGRLGLLLLMLGLRTRRRRR